MVVSKYLLDQARRQGLGLGLGVGLGLGLGSGLGLGLGLGCLLDQARRQVAHLQTVRLARR
eukprot:scaffold30103_cov71-Phaeocystis_antarctica.AAC.2